MRCTRYCYLPCSRTWYSKYTPKRTHNFISVTGKQKYRILFILLHLLITMATTVTFKENTTACGCIPSKRINCLKKVQTETVRPVRDVEEEVLAEGLSGLSFDERERFFQDVQGDNTKPINEEPSFVASRLVALEEEIREVKGKIRVGYDLAIRKDSQYVEGKNFRLKFLRADEFSAKKAANRMMKHFDTKLQLFGEDKLVKDITFDDLSDEDQVSASTGSHQLIFKDVKGRTIIFIFPPLFKAATWQNFARAQWYHFMVSTEMESTQRYGIVAVLMGTYERSFIRTGMTSQRTIIPALPIRPAAFHFCAIKDSFPSHFKIILDILGKNFKGRFRLHVEDSVISCLYALQPFGINPAKVPMEYDGKPNTALFLDHLEKRKAFERKRRNEGDHHIKPPEIIGIRPTRSDVLLGRGLKHYGNYALDNLVDVVISSYKNASSQFDKTCIILATIKRVHESDGRFLKRDRKTHEWIVADDDVTREAVSTRFRNKMRKMSQVPRQVQQELKSLPMVKPVVISSKKQGNNARSVLGSSEIVEVLERDNECLNDDNREGSTTTMQSSTIVPANSDIILGQGRKHQGNYTLDKLIDNGVVSYKNAPSPFEKSCIVLATIKRVQESGGRFLKLDGKCNGWVVADDDTVRKTVGDRYRNKARKIKK